MIDVEICNSALTLVESPRFIRTLQDDSTAAKYCREYYDDTRRELLRSHPWAWATISQKLEVLDYDHPEWSYSYEYPSDVIHISRVFLRNSSEEQLFAVEARRVGESYEKTILANVGNLYMRGTLDINEDFDPLFKRYFIYSLAEVLAKPLKATPGVLETVSIRRLETENKAMAADSSEAKIEDPVPQYFKDRIVGY